MNLNQVTVYSTDVPASVEFYTRLGLRLIVDSAPRYVRFECPEGDATFSVHHTEKPVTSETIIYFECEDLDATVERLKKSGLQFESDPIDRTWLWRESYLRDPGGKPHLSFLRWRKSPKSAVAYKIAVIKNMSNLKTFCLLFLLFGLFTNCSSAQDKTVTPPPLNQIAQPASAKFNAETQRFESIGGKFTISISQVPSETRDLGTETANEKGIDVGKVFIWKFPERAIYTIMYKNALDANGKPLDFDGDPKTQNLRDLETAKIYMRKGIANSNAKIISEKSISFKTHPGTEFRYVSVEGVKFIGRVYSINSIGYQIVGGYADDKNEKEVLAILDSFELLPEKN